MSRVIVVCLVLFLGAIPIYAIEQSGEPDAIAITVVIPPAHEEDSETTAAQPPQRLFPVSVTEGYNDDGVRVITRTYELLPGENPEWINTKGFERNGYYYQIADIIREAIPSHEVREHTEAVEVQTARNDLAAVILELDATIDFTDEDGFAGTLELDIHSIKMTRDGTRTMSRTVSQVREYPHLSSPDVSFIPKTVTSNGHTYNLADVNWQAATESPIDFEQVAQTFTALATYTRTATSSVSTGYTTRAEYNGTLTRISMGDVRFVATFIGVPIVTVLEETEDAEEEMEEITEELETEEDEDEILEGEVIETDEESRALLVPIIILSILVIGVVVFVIMKLRFKKNIVAMFLIGILFALAPMRAAAIPPYSFGGGERAVHIESNQTVSDNAHVHTVHGNHISARTQIYEYGDFLGTLRISRLGRTISVYGGATMHSMERGAGHFSFTGLTEGNVGLIGHNRGRFGFFSFVRNLREGDEIVFTAGGAARTYRVLRLATINETDFSYLEQFGDNRLTLITCVEGVRDRRRVAVAIEI